MTTPRLSRILIADDNPAILQLTADMLAGEPYEIETSVDGRDALEKIDSFHPDLVILDVMMPEMNGFSVCRHIRKTPELAHIKIIMYSAMAMPADPDITQREGGDVYLPKPFSPQQLVGTVRELLAKPPRKS